MGIAATSENGKNVDDVCSLSTSEIQKQQYVKPNSKEVTDTFSYKKFIEENNIVNNNSRIIMASHFSKQGMSQPASHSSHNAIQSISTNQFNAYRGNS